MGTPNSESFINKAVQKSTKNFDPSLKHIAIILAAGHGKRIKSQTSKMLHKIWEKSTVERVYEACKEGLGKSNIIVVVGIKALDVMNVIGIRKHTSFAYQKYQNGTGHAVQVALEKIRSKNVKGTVFVLPGDMGLIDKKTLTMFKNNFSKSNFDMMVLTGLYSGPISNNLYGRIVRVKEKDISGMSSGNDKGKVIEIIEHKDIMKLTDKKSYIIKYNGREYAFSKKELLENNEFNSGVYAFKFDHLKKLIKKIKPDNAQNEIYITDLISIFNKEGLAVGAVHPHEQHVLMGFNNKSVLRQMESIARQKTYDQLKDIIEIEDPDDFFIHESVVKQILKMDKAGQPLDIKIGKGVYLGNGVKPNYNLNLKRNVFVNGNVIFGTNVTVWENAYLSTFSHQRFIIDNNVEILWGNIIKGNIIIGKNSRIESSVNMTGSDEFPLRIGKRVTIKGTSYLFGSIIDDEVFIEHCVLIKKHVEKPLKRNGEIQKIRFFLPMPEGIDTISDLK